MVDTSAIPADKLEIIRGLAEFAVRPRRAPILKTPADYDLEYEDLFFPSADGTPLEAWFIPADSDRLVVMNHPMMMNRYGFPGHLDPWSDVSDFEVDFIPIKKHLHEAGYNVLTYDLRNHGESGAANGGVCGVGRYEWRDCVGAQNFVDSHPRLSKMKLGLYSQCTGGNAQYEAIARHPELFENALCLFAPLTLSMASTMRKFAELQGVEDYMDEMEFEERRFGGFTNTEMRAQLFAPYLRLPVFMTQVKEDAWSTEEDHKEIFDLAGSEEKEFFWIEGTTRRFDGYNYYGENPERMLAFFDRYMK
ncbi:MAG: alpha/beta hydrolase [Pseudomonadota bacterium]